MAPKMRAECVEWACVPQKTTSCSLITTLTHVKNILVYHNDSCTELNKINKRGKKQLTVRE